MPSDGGNKGDAKAAGARDGVPVSLAHEPSLRLGPLLIEPAMRRIAHQDGREEFVEPRVMQVLVALVRADGAILSRDDLAFRCWDGRIVGDDAINRVLSRLRRTADTIGRGVFRVETLTKVGYRLLREGTSGLVEVDRVPGPSMLPGGSQSQKPARRPRIHAGVWIVAPLLLLLAAVLALALWRGPVDAVPTVAVIHEPHGAEAVALARDVMADLSRLAGARAAELAVVDASEAGTADYLVRIGGERRGDRFRAQSTLVGRADGDLLWSASFERPLNEAVDLRQQMAVKIGGVLLCTLQATTGRGRRLDRVTLRLFLAFCDRYHDNIDDRQLELIRQVTERAPDFARGWAHLAVTEAALGEFEPPPGQGDDSRRRAYRDAARAHLERARRMDPSLPENFIAEAKLVTEPRRWAERIAIYDRGIAAAPDARLYNWRTVELMRVGRITTAVESAARAAALDPLAVTHSGTHISALSYAGDFEAARRRLEEAERIWPGSIDLFDARFRLDLRYGDPRAALRMLDSPDILQIIQSPEMREATRAFLRARMLPTPANVSAAVRAIAAGQHRDIRAIYNTLQALGQFGRVEEAYRLLATPQLTDILSYGTQILFRPHMRPILHDPRFIAVSRRIGLLDYWQATGHWPDFCSDPTLPYDCRTEARRLPERPATRPRSRHG